MENSKNLDCVTNLSIEEIEHLLRTFQANIENGLENPSESVSLSDIEVLLENMMASTRKTYLETLSQYLSVFDEKAAIKAKKACTEGKELT